MSNLSGELYKCQPQEGPIFKVLFSATLKINVKGSCRNRIIIQQAHTAPKETESQQTPSQNHNLHQVNMTG